MTHRVTVQRRKPGAKRWRTVKVLSTNGRGFWKLTQKLKATTDYRFTWPPTDQYGARGGPGARRATSAARKVTPKRG